MLWKYFVKKLLYYYYVFCLLLVKISHILTNIEDILTIIPHFYILVLILTLNIIFALGRTFTEYSCLLRECGQGGGRGTCWKPADLVLYAVPVFENHHQVLSHPKQAETGVSGYGLDWKRAVWACFRENDHFHASSIKVSYTTPYCLFIHTRNEI